MVIEVKELSVAGMVEVLAEKKEINPAVALEIAQCESELRQFNKDGSILRGRDNPADVGVFQINENWHLTDSRKLGYDIYSTKGNIEYALYLMKRDGIRHWKYSKPCWGKKVALAGDLKTN